jgi:hypothetical protein
MRGAMSSAALMMNLLGVDLAPIFSHLEPGDQIAVSPSLPFFYFPPRFLYET